MRESCVKCEPCIQCIGSKDPKCKKCSVCEKCSDCVKMDNKIGNVYDTTCPAKLQQKCEHAQFEKCIPCIGSNDTKCDICKKFLEKCLPCAKMTKQNSCPVEMAKECEPCEKCISCIGSTDPECAQCDQCKKCIPCAKMDTSKA